MRSSCTKQSLSPQLQITPIEATPLSLGTSITSGPEGLELGTALLENPQKLKRMSRDSNWKGCLTSGCFDYFFNLESGANIFRLE